MGGKRGELLVLCFSGRRLEEDDYTIYTCDQAPVVGAGKTEEEAYRDMHAALVVYVQTLLERSELEDTLKDGAIPFVRIRAAESLAVEIGCASGLRVPEVSETWLVPTPARAHENGQTVLASMAYS